MTEDDELPLGDAAEVLISQNVKHVGWDLWVLLSQPAGLRTRHFQNFQRPTTQLSVPQCQRC